MIRLVCSDLLLHARVWVGTLAVVVAAGFVAATAAGLIETGKAHGGPVREALESVSAAVIVFTAITALIVLSSNANLAVALQQRGYALWQLLGVRPALVSLVVLAQLGIVGAVGASLGGALARSTFPAFFTWAFREWRDLQGISLHLGSGSLGIVTVSIVAVILVSGIRGSRRAARTSPIEALRDPEPPRGRMGWLRALVAAGALVATIALVSQLLGGSFRQVGSMAMFLTPLIAAVLAAAGPLLLPLVLRAWTSLLPARASASWFLARNSAAYRLSQSTAAISPLMVAIALAAGLYTTGATLAEAQAARTGISGGFELPVEAVVILLGGPLLLSAVAAAATVFMSGQAREREFALIRAAGSTQGAIVLASVWEAVIYTITAAILGALATVVGGAVVAAALELPLPAVSFPTLGVVAGGGFALILAATIAPTVAALRHEIPRTLAVE